VDAIAKPKLTAAEAEPSKTARLEPDAEDRDSAGRFVRGNRASLFVGQRSLRFWASVDETRRERRAALLRDKGVTEAEAPQALLDAIDGLVQAVLLRDSAFARIVESGGPATLQGRRRAAFNVWLLAAGRAENHLKLLGLERRSKRVPSPLEYWQQRQDRQSEEPE
jgi:hypothetical protein